VDRVAGFVHGANAVELEDGAFGEWLVAKAGLVMKIPDDMSFEDASALGVGIVYGGAGHVSEYGIAVAGGGEGDGREEWADSDIWREYGDGGLMRSSSRSCRFGYSVGLFRPSLLFSTPVTARSKIAPLTASLKASGFDVTTTCSRATSHGEGARASAVFDYASPTCGADIRAHTRNELYYASTPSRRRPSPQICADALASHPAPSGKRPFYGVILPRCRLAMMLREATPSATRLLASISPSGAGLGSQAAGSGVCDQVFKLAEGLLAERG